MRGIGCAGCLRDLSDILYDSAQSLSDDSAQSTTTTVFCRKEGDSRSQSSTRPVSWRGKFS